MGQSAMMSGWRNGRRPISEPGPEVFPLFVKVLKELNEAARRHDQVDMAQAFKGMARQAGPGDLELILDEVIEFWQEARRLRIWQLADTIRSGLQSLPGLVIEERPGRPPTWKFVD